MHVSATAASARCKNKHSSLLLNAHIKFEFDSELVGLSCVTIVKKNVPFYRVAVKRVGPFGSTTSNITYQKQEILSKIRLLSLVLVFFWLLCTLM